MTKVARKRLVGALDEAGRGVVIEQDIPTVKRGHILVRVAASVISPGTELSQAKRARAEGRTAAGKPAPFGYQNAGEIIELGGGVRQFAKGDRVACMGASYALHTNYAVLPQNLCAKIPDNVTFEQAAYCHLVMTSLHTIRRGEPQIGENLLIVGLGIVGQFAAQFGRMAGMFVMGWDTLPGRIRIAKSCGLEAAVRVDRQDARAAANDFTRGAGFDMAVMAYGGDGTDALAQAIETMKLSPDGHHMGRVCIVGGLRTDISWPTALGNVDLRAASRTGPGYHDDDWEAGKRDYPPVFMQWTTRTNMELVLRLMSEKKLKVRALTTHRLPLAEIDKAVTAHCESPGKTLGTVLLME